MPTSFSPRLCAPFFSLLALAGCGYPGSIYAPTLDIPVRITDFRAAEFGDRILAQFTIPAMSTENLPLKSVRGAEICIGPAANPFSMADWAAHCKSYPVSATQSGPTEWKGPAADWIGKDVALAVRVTGPKGKVSTWSNTQPLTVEKPLAKPADVKAEDAREAVKITWTGSAPKWRIYRATDNAKPIELTGGDVEAQGSYLDESSIFGMHYTYFVQGVSGDTRLSEPSEMVRITPEDRFPPSRPEGLTGLAASGSIVLDWQRNTDSDFKGYNIYRATGDGAFEKIASLVTTPSYTDRAVETGKTYRYQVSAVGQTDLESAKSEVAEITAQ